MSRRLRLVALLLPLAAAACLPMRQGEPAPFVIGGQPGPSVGQQAAAPAVPPGGIAVLPGDTVYTIAQRQNVALRDLIEANRLSPPYVLQPGQVLTIPTARVHRVASGETLNGLAQRLGYPAADLIRANNLKPPYKLIVGQVLRLPNRGGATTVAVAQRPPAAPAAAPSVAPARPAAQPQPAPSATAPTPAAARPPAPPVQPPAAPAPAPAAIPAAPPAPAEAPPTPQVATAPAPAPPPEAAQAEPIPAVTTPPPPRAGSRFLWPVNGRVVSEFGPKAGGLHNDGINILAKAGTPIKAADNGVVVYAGNELRGFGNLVLIRHDGGWMTAYAHAETMTVKRGDKVRRGQTVATVGATGSVSGPQLHFEVRKGNRPVDPRPYLEARGA